MSYRSRVQIGFFRCSCGKLHQYAGVGPSTLCKCGNNLHSLLYPARKASPPNEFVKKWSVLETAKRCAVELAERQRNK